MAYTALNEAKAAAANILASYWDRMLPVRVDQIAISLGAHVVPLGPDLGQFSGYFSWINGVPTIQYNVAESLNRQRFTIAHELGHYVLGHRDSPRDTPGNFSSGVSHPSERAANQFAAEILMPEEAVRFMVDRVIGGPDEMAKYFVVSPAAMGYRLMNLGFHF